MKRVKEILFDEETHAPVFVLEDGTMMKPFYFATGNCWHLTWSAPSQEGSEIK